MAKISSKKVQKRKSGQRDLAPRKSSDILVTEAMLYSVRDELKSDNASIILKMRAMEKRIDARFHRQEERFELIDSRFESMEERFEKIDARFESMEARFEKIDARFESMEARFDGLESMILKLGAKIDDLSGQIHRQTLLIEQQENRNRFVLDGYTSLNDRLEVVERKLNDR